MAGQISAKSNGTQVSIQVNAVDAVVIDSTGIVSGVNKSAVSQMPTLMTAQNTTSGTSIDFTSIPSWVKRITIGFNGISTSGVSNIQIQLGSGSPTTSGYVGYSSTGASNNGALTTGFWVSASVAAAALYSGIMTLVHLGGNLWAASSTVAASNNYSTVGGGTIQLAGVLDRIRLTTVGGTDTFDAGSVNVLYE